MNVLGYSRRLVVVVALVSVMAGVVAAPAGADTFETMWITEDTTLTEDHYGEIRVAADGITLDCDGHTVKGRGDGRGWGISSTAREGIAVRDCVVKDHGQGIVLRWTDAAVLEGNMAVANRRWGINLISATDTTVVDNRAERNGLDGFALWRSANGNELINNESVGNGRWGFELAAPYGVAGPSDNVLTGNTARGNFDYGFYLEAGSGNTLSGNNATNNGSGFLLWRGSGNDLSENRAVNNKDGYGFVIAESHDNSISGNVAKNNEGTAFAIQASDRNTIHGNVAEGTGAHGDGFTFVNSSQNTVTENSSFRNGWVGIHVFFASEGNVFGSNQACRNGAFDAVDISTGTGNTWEDNDFCTTSGL